MKRLFAFASFFLALAWLFSSRTAFADELHDEHEHVHQRHVPIELVGEGGIGVRSVNLGGMTLGTAGVSGSKPQMTVRGDDVSIFALAVMTIGGGLRVGPVIAGVEIGAGVGGGAHAKEQREVDIVVRPTGFAAAMTGATYLGAMLDKKGYRLRLDAVLGTELIGLGMGRPGYDDTSVSAVNQSRTTLGPRLRVDFFTGDGPTAGMTLGCDALNPGNVTFGLAMTFP